MVCGTRAGNPGTAREPRGGAAAPLTAALPGGGAAEHGGELRGHVRSIAEVESGRRVARVGRLLVRAARKVGGKKGRGALIRGGR